MAPKSNPQPGAGLTFSLLARSAALPADDRSRIFGALSTRLQEGCWLALARECDCLNEALNHAAGSVKSS